MTKMLERVGVPGRIASFRPSDSTNPRWSKYYSRLREQFGKGRVYILCGGRGVGKSTMAACLCGKWITEGRKEERDQYGWSFKKSPEQCARMVDAVTMFLQIRQAYGPGSTVSELDMLETFLAPMLLVIDQLEMRGDSDYENRMLDYIVTRRFELGGRDTIIVTNRTKDRLSEALGPNIVSRINYMGFVIGCDWETMRERV